MRTWILCAAFLVIETIHPDKEFNMTISIFVMILLIAGVLMDAIEFKKKF